MQSGAVRAGKRSQDDDKGAHLGVIDRGGKCKIFHRWGIWGCMRGLGWFVDSICSGVAVLACLK